MAAPTSTLTLTGWTKWEAGFTPIQGTGNVEVTIREGRYQRTRLLPLEQARRVWRVMRAKGFRPF